MDDTSTIDDIINRLFDKAEQKIVWPPDGKERTPEKTQIAQDNQLSNAESRRVFKENIYPSLFLVDGKPRVGTERSTMYITGGQAGAGKTAALIPMLQKQCPSAILAQVGSLALNHPARNRIEGEHPSEVEEATLMDAYKWLYVTTKLAAEQGLDIIVERTLRSLPQEEVDEYKSAGFDVKFPVLAVSELESALRIHEKYIEGIKNGEPETRLTDMGYHSEGYAGMSETIRELEAQGNTIQIYECGSKVEGQEPEEPKLRYQSGMQNFQSAATALNYYREQDRRRASGTAEERFNNIQDFYESRGLIISGGTIAKELERLKEVVDRIMVKDKGVRTPATD